MNTAGELRIGRMLTAIEAETDGHKIKSEWWRMERLTDACDWYAYLAGFGWFAE